MKRVQIIRKFQNNTFSCLCVLAVLFGISILSSIFYALILKGFPALSWNFFTVDTPPPEYVGGGLRNAIVGSFIITVIAVAVATPVGIFAATYLSEYVRGKKIASTIRFVNDVWLSAPSIIVGLFVYTVFVHPMGNYSAIAGAISLAMIACPIITRSTEDMLNLVPNELREAAIALGLPKWRVIVHIAWKASKQGILTGILLAIARISGETAPLLFTSLNNQFWSTSLVQPIANLPVTIYQFAMSPYGNWQELAWGGALLITVIVLFLNILTRYFTKPRGNRS
ncbi:phosphate ABC transporter permease PstA [Fluviispira multicolorata]|uniref:Phosphate transport system permease protein PstA n=1 Tax=Fluviispira multicolorata TaxID=2654512 RepID=A0A833N7Y3_9BACT|nr:phosphate ABC transporter permease PstA [Fluviispira multicolorata]KAB8033446.1 phosphate ABC transporter permease PstA [Fluviispira multicolorata]